MANEEGEGVGCIAALLFDVDVPMLLHLKVIPVFRQGVVFLQFWSTSMAS